MPDADVSTEEILSLLSHLLCDYKPEVTDDLQRACEQYPGLRDIVAVLIDLRALTSSLSKGDLDRAIPSHGFVVSNLKALQANLHHLVWQMTQVSKGDFSQRIDFLGEFSESFNAMCEKLQTEKSALEELAQYDSLTKLANRQFLNSYLDGLYPMARANNMSFSVLMIDIDYFKRVNDTYGHDVGDRVLEYTAQYLNAIFRTTDFTARYGGEEFVAILPEASVEQALMIAGRVLEYFDEHSMVIHDDLIVHITVSIGVSELRDEDTSPEQVIKRSDTALYEAKNNGRNRMEFL